MTRKFALACHSEAALYELHDFWCGDLGLRERQGWDIDEVSSLEEATWHLFDGQIDDRLGDDPLTEEVDELVSLFSGEINVKPCCSRRAVR